MFSDAPAPQDLNGVLVEVLPWLHYNFPGVQPWQQMFGLFEELGEYIDDYDRATLALQRVDSIADATIFLFGYCALAGIDPLPSACEAQRRYSQRGNSEQSNELQRWYSEATTTRALISAAGRFAHVELKASQGIRILNVADEREAALTRLFGELFAMMNAITVPAFGVADPEHFIAEVWSKVRCRDWKNRPTDAHEVKP